MFLTKCHVYMVEHHSLHSFAIKKKKRVRVLLVCANTQNALQRKYRTSKKIRTLLVIISSINCNQIVTIVTKQTRHTKCSFNIRRTSPFTLLLRITFLETEIEEIRATRVSLVQENPRVKPTTAN